MFALLWIKVDFWCLLLTYRKERTSYERVPHLVYKRETAGTIKKVALDAGMQTLRMDGARKVLAGVTTVSEVLRVTQADIL